MKSSSAKFGDASSKKRPRTEQVCTGLQDDLRNALTVQDGGERTVRRILKDCRVFLDDLGYIESVTSSAARFLERSRDSLLRTPFATLVSEGYRRLWLTHFLAYRQPGGHAKTRLAFDIGRSKRTVDVSTETSSQLGRPRFIVTLHESPRRPDRKSQTRRTVSNLVQHIYDLVITVDRRGTVTFINRPLPDRLPEQVIGSSVYDCVRPYDLKRFRMAIERSFTSGKSTDFINEGLACFARNMHFRVRVKPLPVNGGGRKAGKMAELAMILIGDITDQYRAEEELNRVHQNRLRVARRANLIREEERKRLAMELHDQVGQSLTALKIDLSLASRKLKGKDRESKLALSSAESAVDELVKTIRELSAELRPPLLDDLGLVAAIQFQLEAFEKRTGIVVTFNTKMEEVSTRTEIALGVFRVFQETMTNVIRHSHASHVEVNLAVHGGWLFLTVSDNGRGITEEEMYSPKSLGLIGIRERAEQLGGAIRIQAGSAEGTTVVMHVPVAERRSIVPQTRL